MQQTQCLFEHVHQHRRRARLRLPVAGIQRNLRHLDVPVGVLTPQELVRLAARFAVFVVVHQARHSGDGGV